MSKNRDVLADDVPAVKVAGAAGRGRSVLAAVVGVFSVVLLMLSTVAVWARSTVFDSQRVADIVGDSLGEPEVETALALYVTDRVFDAIDVDAAVANAIPGDIERFETLIAASARPAVERALTRAFAEPTAQNVITELVERAHRRAMDVLESGGLTEIASVDGQASINLLPLIVRGLERLQELGIREDVRLPELTADGDPQEQIAQLEAATGRDLPENFGQLVFFRSDRLADRASTLDAAQRIVALSKRAVWVMLALSIVGIAATVAMARDRWRAVLWLGLGAVVAMVIIRTFVHRVVDDAPDLAATPGGRSAISSILSGASTTLLRLAGVILIVGAAAAIAALIKRRWRRDDLVISGAMLSFAAVLVVLGFNLLSVIIGVVLAMLFPVIVRQFAPDARRSEQAPAKT